MEKRINTLFYNFNKSDIEGIVNRLPILGYSIQYHVVSELGELKSEIKNSIWDVVVADYKEINEALEDIFDFIYDLHSSIRMLVVSEKADAELIKLIFKNDHNDLVIKNNNEQISLGLIRNFEKTQATQQLEFTKDELIHSQLSQNENYNFLNQVIESTDNPIFYKGVNGFYLGCNQAFAKFVGLPKDQIVGKTPFDVSPKELAQKYTEKDKEFFENPEINEYVINVEHSAGYPMTVLFHKSPLKDEKGNLVGLLGHMFDITNKQKVEKALHESEQKYKMLVENMQEGLSIVDLNEIVIFCNSAFDHIFGFDAGEMIGKDLKNFIVEEDLQKTFYETEKRKENKNSKYKVNIKRKDNKKRMLSVSSVPWKNPDNEIVGAIGLIMDITAHEYSTRRLQKRIDIEQAIIKISSQFISTINFDQKLNSTLLGLKTIIDAERYEIFTIENNSITFSNEFYYDTKEHNNGLFEEISFHDFKYSLSMLDNFDFVFFDDITKLPEEAAFEKETFRNFQIFNFLGIPFYSESKLAGFVAISNIYEVDEWTLEDLSIFRTITDIIGHVLSRKRAEEQVKQLHQDLITKNGELEQVVYVTSHDIRSPVVNILGFSDEMIKALNKLSDKIFIEANAIQNADEIEYLLKKDIPQILNFIKVSGQKIDKLLMALLKLSRLGRAAINKTNVNMNQLVKSILSTFEYRIKQDKIAVELGDLHECYTDEMAINQVLSNLIDNAIKYASPDRETLIKITSQEYDDQITFCVEDNGIGIPEPEIDKIFDVFYRINPENQQGEGIGLSLIKKIIERLNGKITLGSQEGKGTKFFISLEKQINHI